ALPAFAEVQNIKVTGSVLVRGFYRDNYGTTGSGAGAAFSDGNATLAGTQAFASAESRDWYNTQTRLGVSADLTDNVAASILIANERDWQNTASNASTISLKNSYITFKEMLYSPLTLKVGKMGLKVADKLVVGDGSIGANTFLASDYQDGKSFDAIVGILDYDPMTLVLGTIKVGDAAQSATDDVDLYLIDAIYKFEDDMNTVLDAYFATAHYNSPDSDGTAGVDRSGPTSTSTRGTDVNVLAAVLTTEPMESLSAKLAVALQNGDYVKSAASSRNLDAMAIDLFVDYAIENDYSAKVGLKYVYRSGEDSSNTGDFEGWLPLYEDQCNGIIYDPNTNISAFAITASAAPADRLTVGAEYWMYSLDETQTAVANVTSTDDEAGQELDLTARYAYTEDVSMGLELAWFFPGNYYVSGNDKTAQQVMIELGVKF
ncbi:MAG: alginate export family protein, partial [Candidatus Pacebacteria bacterium]|nr:alginate export family protein [Candidatus Paceibacterota bacterium]